MLTVAEGDLLAFPLPSDCSLVLPLFFVEVLFCDTVVKHTEDVAYQPQMSLADGGGDDRKVCLLQNPCATDFVRLTITVTYAKEIFKASDMNLVDSFYMISAEREIVDIWP